VSKRFLILVLAPIVLLAATAPGWAQDTTPPSVPGSVNATSPIPTRVTVTWTASTDDVGVAGYKIYQNGNQVGVATGTSFTDVYGNVLPSTTYSYTVSAYDAAGNDSGQSAVKTVTTGAAPSSPQQFNMSGCGTKLPKPHTQTWTTTITICDAKYHWEIRWQNYATTTNIGYLGYPSFGGVTYYTMSVGGSSGCVNTSAGANTYLPNPGVYNSLSAHFVYGDVLGVEYVRLHRDSWYDRFAPKVMNVTSNLADGTYGVDQVVDVRVTFSEVVNVTGAPRLLLETGDTDRYATYSSGSGSRTLVFLYTVQADDISSNLDYVATNSLQLNGGTIRDGYGNNATLTLPGPGAPMSLGNNKNIVIDTNPPPATIGEVKKLADGVSVSLTEKTVTAVFTDHFYIQDESSSGIRVTPVEMPVELAVGDSVDITGTLATTSDSERSL
jgi:chitodextrinase